MKTYAKLYRQNPGANVLRSTGYRSGQTSSGVQDTPQKTLLQFPSFEGVSPRSMSLAGSHQDVSGCMSPGPWAVAASSGSAHGQNHSPGLLKEDWVPSVSGWKDSFQEFLNIMLTGMAIFLLNYAG